MEKEQVSLKEAFNQLKQSPKELWIIYQLKFLESFAFYSNIFTLSIFLSQEYGFSDQQAGAIIGLMGIVITLYGLIFSWIIDYLGVRKSLLSGTFILAIGRLILALCQDKETLLLDLFVILPIGGALGIPVMTIGVRRYTSNITRSIAFSLFYMTLSIGLVVATPVIDIYRSLFQEPFKFQYSEDYQIQMTAFRMLYATSSFISLCKFLIVFFFLREFDFETDQEGQRESQAGQENGLQIMKEVIRSKSFWKFTLLMCLLTGVRMTLRHIDATLPKYMTREIGEDAKFGTTIMLNGLIIIICTPCFTIFTYKYKSLDLIKFGTFITGFSPFILCFGASYLTCATFVIVLTIGEAVWSPRVFDITFEFAQKNREGTYMALSYSPTYASILMSSILSGILLQHYCPLDGEKNSQMMWFIIGCTTISSPILIALLGPVIHKHNEDDTIQCFQKIKYDPLSKDDQESDDIDAPYPITFTNNNKKID